jgi:quinol-cytochrome oxidoreductase complex cytochrome b subunit
MEIEQKENDYKEDLRNHDNIKKKKFIKIKNLLLILIIFICFGVFLIYIYVYD